MTDTYAKNRRFLPFGTPKRGGYWSGCTICLLVLVFSVFTWVVHRRLAQYESMHPGSGHSMTAVKVCLTERPRISIPTVQAIDSAALMFVAFVLAGAVPKVDGIAAFHGRDGVSVRPFRSRSRSCLAHFFFLPPPHISSL